MINDQGKYSSKNTRYNLTSFPRDQFYIPTETNLINQGQRRITSTSYRKNKFSQEQTGFPRVYTSGCPHNTANLYLNKKNFSFKKKPNNKGNKYFDKEKLYQNMVKLQISLNNINMKYHKQKMENDKQAKEIERQNKFLNSINSQNMRNWDLLESQNLYKNDNNINSEEFLQSKNDNLMKNIIKENESSSELDFVMLDDKRFNLKSVNNNNKTMSENSLKKLYEELYQECKYRDKLLIRMEKDKEKFTRENGILKVANETLISNLKLHMKKLENENAQKDAKITELKKNLKCSRYTELLKENEILNSEMERLKNKLKNALTLINEYKKQEEEIKKLYEVIKKKDFKIKALELELTTLANNSDETTKKLQNEINTKDKLLKRQERDIKKSAFEHYASKQGFNYTDMYSSDSGALNKKNKKKEIDVNTIYKKYPELYLLFIEMKHKDITNSKNFGNEVLKNIKDTNSLEEAKIKYISLVLGYFNISDDDENSKQVVINLANKEFISNRSIFEIKKRQLNILDSLFNKQINNQNEEIKNHIENNSLEELIKQTFIETDKNKLGFINFDEMKNVINETHLNDFTDEIMLLTKSEIFDRFDYYNLLMLFANEINNRENTENKTDEGEQAQINNENNDINNNKENNIDEIKEQKGESNDNKIEEKENTDDVNNNNTEEKKENDTQNNDKDDNKVNNVNEENKNNEKTKNDEFEKKLKLIVHKIKTEGGAPANYFSQLKENKNINGKDYEIINVQKLKEFLDTKKIELTEEDINNLKKEYGIKLENIEDTNLDEYINNENFVQKLLNIIQNESDNDDNFMENIPKMDFADE